MHGPAGAAGQASQVGLGDVPEARAIMTFDRTSPLRRERRVKEGLCRAIHAGGRMAPCLSLSID